MQSVAASIQTLFSCYYVGCTYCTCICFVECLFTLKLFMASGQTRWTHPASMNHIHELYHVLWTFDSAGSQELQLQACESGLSALRKLRGPTAFVYGRSHPDMAMQSQDTSSIHMLHRVTVNARSLQPGVESYPNRLHSDIGSRWHPDGKQFNLVCYCNHSFKPFFVDV